MTRIAITGVGVVSTIGVGEAAFTGALYAGACAIGEVTSEHGLRIGARVGEFGARQAIAPAAIRRMPRLTQMTIVAAKEALAAASLPYAAERVGVIAGTGLGNLDETLAFTRSFVEGGAQGASPSLFPVSVMNAATGQLAIECKLRGVNTTFNHRDGSALAALGYACDTLALGRADALVVAGFDELSAPVEHGYAHLGGVTSSIARPYDVARDGLAPGEGAACIVVEREEDARKRGARVRAIVGGRGETGEDRPRVGWGSSRAWPEAERAVREAARAARVDWIAGGGNGSSLDERELAALAGALGALAPTSSFLGATGEYFASAMLRVIAAIAAIDRRAVPGTVGLERAPRDFESALVRAPRELSVDAALVPSFAQGGANLAVVIERA